MSNNNTLLCDMGGTHARFARLVEHGEYADFKKYRLNDFTSFENIVQTYMDETGLVFQDGLFAVARTPINGRIEYSRHAGDPDYIIDFNITQSYFKWMNLKILNDLEAGAYGVNIIKDNQLQTLLTVKGDVWNANKTLISVGTGVGHAGVFNNQILQTAGGHFLPITVTETHRKIEKYMRKKKDATLSLIMEDFVSGRGLRMIAEYVSAFPNDDLTPEEFMSDLRNHPDAITLFFEFLGLYAHNIVSVTGFYGGVYLTGGVIDNLIKNNLTDWAAFEKYFRPPMLSVVNDRLNSTSVSYVTHDELPLLGLTVL
jgi:glucokinase